MAGGLDSTTAPQWRHLKEPSITARIRDEVIRVIDEDGLSPGDRLPSERKLAEDLSVSRPSIREAIRVLQSEGRLIVEHGRGVFVAEAESAAELRRSVLESMHSTEELFAMREVLEVPAARWAAEVHNKEALAKVQRSLDLLVDASWATPPNFSQLQLLDMDFHLAIVQASGNRFLAQTQGVLNAILAEGMQSTLDAPGRLEQSRAEHRAILDALLVADGAAAAEAAKRHIHAARDTAIGLEVDELEQAAAPELLHILRTARE